MPRDTYKSGRANSRANASNHSLAEVQPSPNQHYWWDKCGYWSITTPIGQDVFNEIENPSFEFNTNGWVIAGGGNPANLSSTPAQSAYGRSSALVNQPVFLGQQGIQYVGAPSFTIPTLSPGDTAYFSVWVKAPLDTSIVASIEHGAPSPGQNLSIGLETSEEESTGEWQRLTAKITFRGSANPVAPALGISPRVTVTQTGPITPFSFYVDGAMMTRNVDVDTYFDGGTNGGEWLGGIYSSQSKVSRFSRATGKINNFTEFGLDIFSDSGWGMPPVEGIFSQNAIGFGRHFQRQRYTNRTITLGGMVQGCCETDHYQKRRQIQRRMLYNFESYCNEGLTLNYQLRSPCCGALTRRLEARDMQYYGGLQGERDNLYSERVLLQFVSTTDPFWTDPIEKSYTLPMVTGDTVRIEHGSTAPLFPVFEILYTGLNQPAIPQPLAGTGLVNYTIEQLIKFKDDAGLILVPNSSFILDTNPQRFKFYNAGTGEDLTNLIDYEASSLGLPLIMPGVNFFAFDLNGPVFGSLFCRLRFNEKYLSVDDAPLLRRCCSICGSNY